MKKWKILLMISFFLFSFTCVGYAALSDSFVVSGNLGAGVQERVFITDVDVLSGGSNTKVNTFSSTTLNSTVELDNNSSATTVLKVTFYNNTTTDYFFDDVVYLDDPSAYDNTNITFSTSNFSSDNLLSKPVIKGNGYLTCEVTFEYVTSTISNNMLNSLLNFSFDSLSSDSLVFVDGNSADNIKTVNDGSTNYDGSNTQYRWTSWSPDENDRGLPVAMVIPWGESTTFDKIKLYHFIDAAGCDFPESIEIYYYDEELDDYVLIEDYTKTENWSNATRNRTTGVYTMNIDGESVTFSYSYKGTPPITTITLNESITTKGLKIIFNAKEDWFVGLLEIEVFNGSENVLADFDF